MHIWDSIHCSGWGWSAKKSQSLLWQQFLRAADGQGDHDPISLPGTASARGQCLRRGETDRAPQPEWTNPWTNSESPFASQVISSNMILYHPYWSLFFVLFFSPLEKAEELQSSTLFSTALRSIINTQHHFLTQKYLTFWPISYHLCYNKLPFLLRYLSINKIFPE